MVKIDSAVGAAWRRHLAEQARRPCEILCPAHNKCPRHAACPHFLFKKRPHFLFKKSPHFMIQKRPHFFSKSVPTSWRKNVPTFFRKVSPLFEATVPPLLLPRLFNPSNFCRTTKWGAVRFVLKFKSKVTACGIICCRWA